jgi:hypothetical protein
MQHAPSLQPPLRLSGPGQPEFAWERFGSIAHELPPLLTENWRETVFDEKVAPLSIDFDRLYQYDIAGALRILTVRRNKALVGYVFLLVGPHPNHKTVCYGMIEKYWLDPAERAGWTGLKMFKMAIAGARLFGCKVMHVASTIKFEDNRVTKLLQRLGFVPTEIVHTKVL